MIHTRFGSEVVITANCGSHHPKYMTAPETLVKIKYLDDNSESFYFIPFLKATDGWPEIEAAVSKASVISLAPDALKKAFNLAE